ncbi:MAG: hypothetical protein VKI82_15020 [Leptolyngbya sp.]|nr:hypothetical protein [Leptolyngbya sp.]
MASDPNPLSNPSMASDVPHPRDGDDNGVPWKWIAAGCGGCLTITIAALVTLVVLMGRAMQFAFGPDGVNTDETPFTYTLPGESEGVLDMTMFGMRIVQITSTNQPPSAMLTMGRLPGYLQSSADQASFIESFQEGMIGDENYQLSPPRTEERTLCGQTVPVVVQTGQLHQDETTYAATSLMAAVDHNDRTQFVWILAHGDQAEATLSQVFDSLDCR